MSQLLDTATTVHNETQSTNQVRHGSVECSDHVLITLMTGYARCKD